MLKHQDIIGQMSEREKADFLAGKLPAEECERLGLPVHCVTELRSYNRGLKDGERFPSYEQLANAWNVELTKSVAGALAARARRDGATAVVLPSANVKSTVYADGASEDPFLAGELSSACIDGVAEAGVVSRLKVGLRSEDVELADCSFRERDMREYYAKPFEIALKGAKRCSAETVRDQLSGEYKEVNGSYLPRLLRNEFFKDGCILSGDPDGTDTDGEVDSLINLLASGGAERDEWEVSALTATAQSAVLLKNEGNILPLRGKKRVAVIGFSQNGAPCDGADFAEYLSSRATTSSLDCVGYDNGYDLAEETSERLLLRAKTLAMHADVAVVFLSVTEDTAERAVKNRKLSLPANQLALLNALSATGKSVIGVLGADCSVDVGFDEYCDALLLLPSIGSYRSSVLFNFLTGAVSPSGKLASTLYRSADALFAERITAKNSGRCKTGCFLGYRYYTTAGEEVGYPFGHGLSYTQFRYGGLKVDRAGVTFTVKNTGKFAAYAVVQMYVGKSDSALVRPRRQLKAFERVFLNPNETKTVRILFSEDTFAVFCAKSLSYKTEIGSYELYIGNSSEDIRLTKSIYVKGGVMLEREAETLSDYLRTGNILSDGYTLQPMKRKPAPQRPRARKFGIAMTVIGILSDLIFLLIGIILPWMGTNVPIFDSRFWTIVYLVGTAVINILMIIAVIRWRKGAKKLKRALAENAASRYVPAGHKNEEEAERALKLEELFLNEFEREKPTVQEERKIGAEEREDFSADFEEGLTQETLAQRLAVYSAAHGFSVDPDVSRTILSAMSASRLIAFRCAEREALSEYLPVLSSFFGSEFYRDSVSSSCRETDDLFFTAGWNGAPEKKRLFQAVQSCAENRGQIHIAVLDGVRPGEASFLSPLTEYFAHPYRGGIVPLRDGENFEGRVVLRENLWIFLLPAEEETNCALPSFLTDCGALVEVNVKRISPAEGTDFPVPVYQQFIRLCKEAKNEYAIEEREWKKIDRLERYLNDKTGYRLNNRTWQWLERYTAFYLACGGDSNEALDGAAAYRILPAVLPTMPPADGENGAEETFDVIFGEENASAIKRTVKYFGQNAPTKG